MSHQLRHARANLNNITNQLHALHPGNAIRQQQQVLTHLSLRLNQQIQYYLTTKRERLKQVTQTLAAVSPLATLERGYAIVTDVDKSHVITRATQTKPGDKIRARLHTGEIFCRVEKINET